MEFSAVQIALVLVIALLVFGPHRLPEIGRQVGRGLREARRQISEVGNEIKAAHPEEAARPTATAASPAPSAPASSVASSSGTDDDEDILAGVVVTRQAVDEPATVVMDAPAVPVDDDEALLDGVVLSGDTPPDHRG